MLNIIPGDSMSKSFRDSQRESDKPMSRGKLGCVILFQIQHPHQVERQNHGTKRQFQEFN